MKVRKADWYKEGWTLGIKNHSWVEDTVRQVEFLIKIMELTGKEKILDLACGYGRHSLEFARRGFQVVGVDITKDYIMDARESAEKENLSAVFMQGDIREVGYEQEFDVVLNMADGAVGYLENEAENLKIFDIVAKALKPGGKHFMDIVSADYADTHFPCSLWDAGSNGLTLSKFEWDRESNIMLYGQEDYKYGTILNKPVFSEGCPTRLYHRNEIYDIMEQRHMQVVQMFGKFDGTPASASEIQMMVYSKKCE
ncbi:class I SAM-dependent methyltransferase [Anaeromicropila populeti]|uniref:Methyltransferase domain-containing protein n=1 Tax=Anaeromicropila populeti TaxID=37658 RepID=A0A1I6KJA4_9FIRM|nr:class I SAM-dependent methyltransferase [Anaeromicropila populeti]SFR91323.1 Methyltransferase domain-containing protein [Anaeromicropila populeti]